MHEGFVLSLPLSVIVIYCAYKLLSLFAGAGSCAVSYWTESFCK